MKFNYIKIFFAAVLFSFISCHDFDDPVEDFVPKPGQADFSRYVAIGNSLTAGYTNSALYRSGQENSYPKMLADRMVGAGGGEFKVPYMQDDIGGFSDWPKYEYGKLELKIVSGSLTPVPNQAKTPYDNISANGPYNNYGIPGAKVAHLRAAGYGMVNPYFGRIASSPIATVLEDAMAQDPTFFSLWIGNNDILGYATSGGDGSDVITPVGNFQTEYTALVQGLTANGAKGVVANIPSIIDIPYFTTVPYNPLTPDALGGTSVINALNNQIYAGLNQVLNVFAPERKIVFYTDKASPVVIIDESLPDLSAQIEAALTPGAGAVLAKVYGETFGQARQATAEDLLVFTSQTVLGKINTNRVQELVLEGVDPTLAGQLSMTGITYPLEDKWVLTKTEYEEVKTATEAYNVIIADLASQYDLALVDTFTAMKKLSSQSGIVYFGNTYTTQFVQGGAFSLDGVHLTGKGYAIVANMFVEAINAKYGSTLRDANPNNFPGVHIP